MHMIASGRCVDFDMIDKSPPKIISVVRKHGFCSQSNYRAKLTGKIENYLLSVSKLLNIDKRKIF